MDDLSLQSEQWDFTAIIYQKKVLLKNKAADHHIVSNRIKLIQSAITQATTNLGVIWNVYIMLLDVAKPYL